MKYLIAAVPAFVTTNALAHPGHVEPVAGHTHTLGELALMGVVPIVAGLMLIGLAHAVTRRKND